LDIQDVEQSEWKDGVGRGIRSDLAKNVGEGVDLGRLHLGDGREDALGHRLPVIIARR